VCCQVLLCPICQFAAAVVCSMHCCTVGSSSVPARSIHVTPAGAAAQQQLGMQEAHPVWQYSNGPACRALQCVLPLPDCMQTCRMRAIIVCAGTSHAIVLVRLGCCCCCCR
jgi:hypothetical protein